MMEFGREVSSLRRESAPALRGRAAAGGVASTRAGQPLVTSRHADWVVHADLVYRSQGDLFTGLGREAREEVSRNRLGGVVRGEVLGKIGFRTAFEQTLEEGTRGYLLAPIIRDRKGEYRKEFLELRKQGFQRVKVDGAFYELDEPPVLDKKYRHDIDVVVDRIVVREGLETRLADSFGTALDLADGIAILETAPRDDEDPERITFSENFACPVSGFTIPEIEPRLFSFNAPFGACPECDGLGMELFFDERLVVPDTTLKIYDGALAPWRKGKSPYFLQTIEALAKHYEFDKSTRWKDLPKHVQQVFLYGSGDEEIEFRYDEGGRVYQISRGFEGVIPNMERRYRETDSNWIREEFERFVQSNPLWDGRNLELLMTEAYPESVELRLSMSAETIGDLWTLRCEVREHMLGWIKQNQPDALIRHRLEVEAANQRATGA